MKNEEYKKRSPPFWQGSLFGGHGRAASEHLPLGKSLEICEFYHRFIAAEVEIDRQFVVCDEN